jgi:hypothetical protein
LHAASRLRGRRYGCQEQHCYRQEPRGWSNHRRERYDLLIGSAK